jgi:hypothetical protein
MDREKDIAISVGRDPSYRVDVDGVRLYGMPCDVSPRSAASLTSAAPPYFYVT